MMAIGMILGVLILAGPAAFFGLVLWFGGRPIPRERRRQP